MKYKTWWISRFALSVIKSVLGTRWAFARHVLLLAAKLAAKIIVYRSTTGKPTVKNVTRKPYSIEDLITQYSIPTSTSTQKLANGPMNRLLTTNPKPDPQKPVFICGRCARYKYLRKAPVVWIAQGRCHFCLFQTWVSQIIEYVDSDPTETH